MTYPSYPVSGKTPAFLTAFDPNFMGGPFPDNTANGVTVIIGGYGTIPGQNIGGSPAILVNNWGPMLFGWNGGNSLVGAFYSPQRHGMKYNWMLLNGATVGGGT